MIRSTFRALLGLAVVAFFVYWGSFLGLGAAMGYALLGWVLVRAAPGCSSDVRAVFGLGSGLLSRSARSDRKANATF